MIQKEIQLKYLFDIFSGSTPESGKGFYWDGDIPWITPEDLSQLDDEIIYDTKRKITEEGFQNSGVKMAPTGSIVISKRAPIGLLCILGIDACSNQGCFLLVPKLQINSKYYYYYLLSKKEELQILGRGSTFMELSLDDIKTFKVLRPKLELQNKIVGYLDNEINYINRLIYIKKRQLHILYEKRQALIINAVTEGLNPKAKLKDSGIDWLGNFPQHWELKKVSRIFNKISSGTTPNTDNQNYYFNGIINWVNTGDLNDGFLRETANKITADALDDYTTLKIYPIGSLCIAMYGATIGKTAILSIEACTNQACCVLYDSSIALTEFIQFWFMAMRQQIMNLASGGGQPNISQGLIKDLKIPIPPLNEQREILEHLKTEISKIDVLIKATEKSVELIFQRKSVLIHDAVEGKTFKIE